MYIVGSIPELGDWKERKVKMTWTDGNNWVLDEPIFTTAPYFRYKYVSVRKDNKEEFRWETGVDRIADLRLLEKIDSPSYQKVGQHVIGSGAPVYTQK